MVTDAMVHSSFRSGITFLRFGKEHIGVIDRLRFEAISVPSLSSYPSSPHRQGNRYAEQTSDFPF